MRVIARNPEVERLFADFKDETVGEFGSGNGRGRRRFFLPGSAITAE